MNPHGKALIVIDARNDHFPGGKLPLWNADETPGHIVHGLWRTRKSGLSVVLV